MYLNSQSASKDKLSWVVVDESCLLVAVVRTECKGTVIRVTVWLDEAPTLCSLVFHPGVQDSFARGLGFMGATPA